MNFAELIFNIFNSEILNKKNVQLYIKFLFDIYKSIFFFFLFCQKCVK